MYILGISAFYHDSAAALIHDGKIVCAAEEERFTRVKHDNSFPENAIRFCIKKSGISIAEVDYIIYYEKPLLKFERIIENFISTYPFSLKTFAKSMPEWLGDKIKVEAIIKKKLGYKRKILFIPHHMSHAAAAFFPSEFTKAAILTVDGVGEYQTTGMWVGNKNKIKLLSEINFPNSLGLLYSTFTAFLGFRVNEDEYKVMGMAAYGKPEFVDEIKKIIDIKDDGSFKLNMNYFSFQKKSRMWSDDFEKLFGKERKSAGITAKHKNIAASIQKVTEEVYFKMLNELYRQTKNTNLCVAGGVGLNALANGKIFSNTPFKKIYILGASGDSGGAIGAAMYASLNFKTKLYPLTSLRLGSEYSTEQILKVLKNNDLKYKEYKSGNELVNATAKMLAQGKIIGWFQDKMEFGPRALGSRSIIAAPSPYSMKAKVNIVKKREQFRPFAGSVLEEQADKYFELPKTQKKFPFMNFCFMVKKEKVNIVPAITHEDGTCRIQTVSIKDGIYYDLIKAFYKKTKLPILLNTSFNVKGEPLIESPQDAINDFKSTKLDSLVIGRYIINKK